MVKDDRVGGRTEEEGRTQREVCERGMKEILGGTMNTKG